MIMGSDCRLNPDDAVTLDDTIRALSDVASELPFAIGDCDAANQTYRRWCEHGLEEDFQLLLMWLFCYSRRYFVTKWMQQPDLPPSDLEGPITDAFNVCERQLHAVREPDTFASYVSVICKNTFINYCRRRSRHLLVPADDLEEDYRASDGGEIAAACDRAMFVAAAGSAIERLPPSLRDVVEMRLVLGLSYEDIQARTGHSRATLRSYLFKAIGKLRKDPGVATLLTAWERE
jgi:RNA polymerase sigma factor (sigma-70 family)